ncbi:penicillin-binding protein [uncultured Faecalibaculum sp.]|uniref:penicillin-binding protein n=2 Tax=uncultured Faecalibaculum sp. TaxID=1729681 RepID=UPI0026181DDF|nr:penicillin-binding protein [uncultured Faecalibaculum sp.]
MDVRRTNKKLFRMILAMGTAGTLVSANVLFTMGTHRHIWSQEDVLSGKLASSIVDTTVEAKRGQILDRSANVIAQEVKAYTVVAYLDDSVTDDQGDPNYVQDAKKTAKALAAILDGADEKRMASILEKAMKAGQIQTELGAGTKRLTKEVMEKIEQADIPGIGFVETSNRNYPTSPYSSNLVGFAAFDEDGQEIQGKLGLELTMNDYLSGTNGRVKYQQTVDGTVLPGTTQVYEEAVEGNNVYLTIDSNLQSIVETQLQRTMEDNSAQSAWALVMEPETGKILAWGSYPTYNQNTHQEIPSFLDNIADKNMEVGSVMKPFTYAVAIDTGVYNGDTTYRAGTFTYAQDPSTGKITRVPNGTQTDFKPISDALGNDFGEITFDQGLWVSSNVGICELLANYINYNQYVEYLDKFGFFKATEIPFVTEATGVKNVDSAADYLSTGFGQASSISLLQLCQAYTAIFNDGKMMRPYVVESIQDPETGTMLQEFKPECVGEPISAETAHHVTEIMKGVTQEGNSGARLRIDGVDMAVKTGTGELYNEQTGEYDKTNYTSSVMAAIPADDPKIMVYWGMVSSNITGYSAEPFQEIVKAALIANGVSGASNAGAAQDGQEEETWDTYEMPNLVNHSLDWMNQELNGKKLNVTVLGDGSSVVNQYPSAGSKINSNSRVLVMTDSAGITMPDMTGWTRKDVTAFWALTGIGVQTSGYGKVQAQNVAPGTPVDGSSDIQVTME